MNKGLQALLSRERARPGFANLRETRKRQSKRVQGCKARFISVGGQYTVSEEGLCTLALAGVSGR